MIRRVNILGLGATNPLQSLRLQFFPDKRLKTILVRNIENGQDYIRAVTKAIVMEGGRIVVMRPSDPGGKVIDILYHIECPYGREMAIASRIEELNLCEEVLIVEMPDERLALNILFPYKIMNLRGIVVPETFYQAFLEGIRKRLGEGGAKALLYLVGVETGRKMYSTMRRLLEGRSSIESVEMLFHIWRALGRCMLRSIEMRRDALNVELLNNFEAYCLKRRYSSPQCHFTRGILTGYLGELTNTRWRVEEVRCMAVEGDICRFVAKKVWEEGS